MNLSAWGNQAHHAFEKGSSLEFVMQSGEVPEEGSQVEVKFFNGAGSIGSVIGTIDHVEPGLIVISKQKIE